MRAAVIERDREIRVKEVPDPRPGPGEIVVEPRFASICGTDHHIYLGEFAGRVSWPLIPGHEFAGVVREVADDVTLFAAGDRVAVDPDIPCMRCPACLEGRMCGCRYLKLLGVDMDGGFAEAVACDAHRAFAIPEGLSLEDAALAEVLAIGLHGTGRASINVGDTVVILGAGRLGLALLQVVALSGASRIVSVDISEFRLDLARKLGAHEAINSRECDAVERVLDLTCGVGADRVIEAVGAAELVGGGKEPVTQATEMVRAGGRVVILGQGQPEAPIFFKPLVWKEAEIIMSRVTLGEYPRSLRLLAEGRFRPDLYATHRMGLSETPRAFELIDSGREDVVKIILDVGA